MMTPAEEKDLVRLDTAYAYRRLSNHKPTPKINIKLVARDWALRHLEQLKEDPRDLVTWREFLLKQRL